MLKSLPAEVNKFHKFKCGEIYCVTPTDYEVACCLCGVKVLFDKFPEHFQELHLTKTSQPCNNFGGGSKEVTQSAVLVPLPTKLNDNDVDPIKCEVEEFRLASSPDVEYELKKLMESEMEVDVEEEKPVIYDLELMTEYVEKTEEKTDVPISSSKTIKPIAPKALKPIAEEAIAVAKNDQAQPSDEDEKPADNEDADNDWQNEDINNSDSNSNSSDDDKDSKSIEEFLPFPCTKCSRAYKTKRSLANHLRSCHDPTPKTKKAKKPNQVHKCQECGEEFRNERNLRGHMWKHTGINCDICGKPFTQAGNMMRHRIRHTGVKSHKCKECDNCFYTDKELVAHMMRHTGIWPHMCEICGRRCRDRGVLTAHMRRHTGERPATCGVCGKSFYSFHDLNVHAVTHSTERPFKCDVCGSTFQRKKSLRVHKKLHSTERNHVCKICGKGFVQSTGLTAHMRTHDAALNKSVGSLDVAPTVTALNVDSLLQLGNLNSWKPDL